MDHQLVQCSFSWMNSPKDIVKQWNAGRWQALCNETKSNFGVDIEGDGELAAAYLRKDIGNNWLKMGGPVKNKILACPTISEIKSKVIKYLWDAVNLTSEAIKTDKEHFQSTNLNNKSLDGIHLINEGDIYL